MRYCGRAAKSVIDDLKEGLTMTIEDFDPFKGRAFGNLVFLTTRDRCIYIGLSPWRQKKRLRDHPELWKTREDALRDLQGRAGVDVEAGPAEPRSTTAANEVLTGGDTDGPLSVLGEDTRLPDNPTPNTAPLTIANAEATATAGDEIIIEGRRFISERRFAAKLGYSRRQLQRWRKEGKGPPSTKIGRRVYYEINELQEWIERQKSR
jgi:predicted DNA-binding transcriptional regulator AlpA